MRTLVVGSGASGIPLAVRLSEDPRREVVLLEAGETESAPPAELRDASTVEGAMPGHPANWSHLGHLTPDLPYSIARGRILGGSSAINGSYFVRPRPTDCDFWAAAGGDDWSYPALLDTMRRIETDADYPDSPLHGSAGPMPISRPPQTNPAAVAFIAAATELGFGMEPDKNRPGPIGVGPVPSNIVAGERVSTARAYLGTSERSRIEILGRHHVLRVLIEDGRAIGVETTSGPVFGDEVVLAAGAIGTAHLLLASGVGPGAQLSALGIPVVADLPVGSAFTDHPDIPVGWRAKQAVFDPDERFAFPTALNFSSEIGSAPEGDLEILLAVKPIGYLLTGSVHPLAAGLGASLRHPIRTLSALSAISRRRATEQIRHRDDFQLIVGLQAPVGTGTITLESPDPHVPPRIDYRYLQHPHDLTRARLGVRTAVDLLESRAFSSVFASLSELSDAVLGDDDALNAWMLAHLGTAIHLCGTAPLGSVVDWEGRVHGVSGLRIADTSILPRVPTRGPFASAIIVGERIAEFMRGADPR
ncbi:GMC family oxidoreductase N-terminal domain-containing protein [Agromyces tropicus]|uniref:GMC family oxidoreductase N-terminal domain-containing protein n=1 Tax=Agromyces tropicus TaxID=555371 RepID=A0ABN2U283_9MICO